MKYKAPGVYRMPFGAYCGIRAVNASSLIRLDKSPLHYRAAVENRNDIDSDALRLGRGAHCAVLEPDQFLRDFVLWTGGRRYGTAWDEFKRSADEAGQTILREQDYELALKMRDSVRSHEPAMKYLGHGGDAELSYVWEHKTGNRIQVCKGRVDWTCMAIVDYKTTRNIDAMSFARDAARLRYHTRCAFYQDGVQAVTGRQLPVVLIAAEKEEPYDVAVYRIPDEALEVGRVEYKALLERLADCIERDYWPGVVEDEADLLFPEWIYKDSEPAPVITMGGVPLL